MVPGPVASASPRDLGMQILGPESDFLNQKIWGCGSHNLCFMKSSQVILMQGKV